MPNPDNSAEATVDGYHRAWTTGDIHHAMTYLADDVRCFAPDPDITTKPQWQQYLTDFLPMLTGAPEHARMTDGNRVALWYFPQTAGTTSILASELFTVRDGQIVEIRLAFDRLGYIPPDQLPARG